MGCTIVNAPQQRALVFVCHGFRAKGVDLVAREQLQLTLPSSIAGGGCVKAQAAQLAINNIQPAVPQLLWRENEPPLCIVRLHTMTSSSSSKQAHNLVRQTVSHGGQERQ